MEKIGVALFMTLVAAMSVQASSLDLTAGTSVYSAPTNVDSAAQFSLHADFTAGTSSGRWFLNPFAEVQAGGKFRYSIDLPQAWWEVSPADSQSSIVLGRVHPLQLLKSSEADRGWGLMVQTQAVSGGLNLGPRMGLAFSEPALVGWLGAHWMNSRSGSFRFGVSASPVFIPSMGAGVDFDSSGVATSSRFARSVPAYADLGGGTLVPIRYRIDMSSVLTDVVLQPQLAAFFSADVTENLHTAWILQRAPTPEPDLATSGYLQATPTDVYAVAQVKPGFPERLSLLGMADVSTGRGLWSPVFFVNARAREDRLLDGEIGVRTQFASLSYTDRLMAPIGGALIEGPVLLSRWLQLDAAWPLAPRWTVYGGMKRHLSQRDLWLAAGVRTEVAGFRATLGMDVFAGDDSSWYGEWRANDRVMLTFSRGLGL